jgi:hypothetical protein
MTKRSEIILLALLALTMTTGAASAQQRTIYVSISNERVVGDGDKPSSTSCGCEIDAA